jgi:hypothetical protein
MLELQEIEDEIDDSKAPENSEVVKRVREQQLAQPYYS